ncbi:hypothetical protein GCM10011390_50720 [Aureimonas endophytica]|uniref:Peptidoglycan binding-like domain-containing protein n=1 Tax=Aureimonas endophytica TaxID=2027858 RepID=A0A917A4T5_9HYPH|nr:TIGR02594 family protein [Aureimonas endophytica]GGE25129.1 hypothetical protein GCM10011390_50720 [Aureimonas endophytica]
MVTTKDIQVRLKALGDDPGPIDGIRGRRTIRAIQRFQRFQRQKGLAVDGIVGPVTRRRLFEGSDDPQPGPQPDLPWYEEARRLIGVAEVGGPGNNRDIMDWADDLDIHYAGDEVPWCGLFVAHCIAATLPDEELPANFMAARSWRSFGDACEPTKGCVLVFWRDHPTNSGKGHVGFYAGEDEKGFYVLGGNQSNRVRIARIAKDRLLAARFPATAVFGERRVVRLGLGMSAFDTEEA